jgi:sialidase-1
VTAFKYPLVHAWVLLFSMVCRNASAELEQQDIFVAGAKGYHTYRIPSLIRTERGTLLAFCEGRKGSASDTGNVDLLLKRSQDGGRTWTEQTVVWDESTNTCGNPCPVVDRQTGTIWLLATHNLGIDHEKDITTKRAKGTRTVWVFKSDDDGKTWSAPSNISSAVKDSSWGWYATGPGIGIQLLHGPQKGRLIIPCDHSYATTNEPPQIESGSHIIYSDDHGQTWKLGGVVRPHLNECQIVELATGALLLSMRNHPRGDHRSVSISRDGGATWSPPAFDPNLIDPTCQASIVRCHWPAATERGSILFSNPASKRRENMTVRISYDDGRTWPVGKTLHGGPAAYSCLAVFGEQQIGCLYERGERNAYEKITFARFPLSWLESQ